MHPHSKSATTSHQVSNGFGAIRVTDNEISSNIPNVVHRRYNASSINSNTIPVTNTKVQNPVLWYNRTWHWSTNRTREYDPDLDGTTLPSVDDFEIPIAPPLIEPYETQFPWGILSRNTYTFMSSSFLFILFCLFKFKLTSFGLGFYFFYILFFVCLLRVLVLYVTL